MTLDLAMASQVGHQKYKKKGKIDKSDFTKLKTFVFLRIPSK